MKRGFLLLFLLVFLSPARAAEPKVLRLDGEEIKIIRDRYGVPHVFAASRRGLFYGNGYAVAQDRLWQMERYRRDARGEMATVDPSPRALERDRDARKLGYTNAERQRRFDHLEAPYQLPYTAYVEGVNAWLAEAKAAGKLPKEFADKRIDPAPWRVTDAMAIGDMMANRFGSGGAGELRNLRYLNKLKKKHGDAVAMQIFNDLFWQNDPASPTTMMDETPFAPAGTSAPPAPGQSSLFEGLSDTSLAGAEAVAEQARLRAYAEENGLFSRWGSYAWVVAPGRSASGSAVLVGGPQMGFATPQIAHEVHLSGAGLNVIGMGFAGLPGVLIGHNDHLAWTTTSGATDMADVFVEKLNPANQRQYWFKGQWRDMECRQETIRRADGPAETLDACRTVHGPVLEWDANEPVAYSLAVSYRGHEPDTMRAMLGFWTAQTLEQFAEAAKKIWLTHNFFVATTRGDIGFWHCGRPPVRADGIDLRLPTPGTGEKEWKGVLPVEQIPQLVNPKQGFIYNWNNKPARQWDNGDRPTWGAIFRVHRIRQLLEARPQHTFEQIRDIITDIGLNDPTADYLKPHLLRAIRSTGMGDPRVKTAYDVLSAWDNHAADGSIAKTVFDAWVQALREELFADLLQDVDKDLFTQITQPSLLLHVLEGKGASRPVRYDYLRGRDVNAVQMAALEKAVRQLMAQRGPAPALWGYFQPKINFKPLPPIPATQRGTYIMAAELAQPVIRGVSVLPPGQSEDPQSPHFGDQRELAGYWQFKPMLYTERLLELAEKLKE